MAPYAVGLLMLLAVSDRQVLLQIAQSMQQTLDCPPRRWPESPRVVPQCSYFTDEMDCTNLAKTHAAGTCGWDVKGGVCEFGAAESTTLPSIEFRLLCGLGAIPAFIVSVSPQSVRQISTALQHDGPNHLGLWSTPQVMLSAMKETDSAEFEQAKANKKSIWQEVSEHPKYWRTLIGHKHTSNKTRDSRRLCRCLPPCTFCSKTHGGSRVFQGPAAPGSCTT